MLVPPALVTSRSRPWCGCCCVCVCVCAPAAILTLLVRICSRQLGLAPPPPLRLSSPSFRPPWLFSLLAAPVPPPASSPPRLRRLPRCPCCCCCRFSPLVGRLLPLSPPQCDRCCLLRWVNDASSSPLPPCCFSLATDCHRRAPLPLLLLMRLAVGLPRLSAGACLLVPAALVLVLVRRSGEGSGCVRQGRQASKQAIERASDEEGDGGDYGREDLACLIDAAAPGVRPWQHVEAAACGGGRPVLSFRLIAAPRRKELEERVAR